MPIESCFKIFAIADVVTIALFAVEYVNEVHKKSACFIKRFMCPGTDLNRYDRCGSQDFKSCVSTNSTTGATFLEKYFKNFSQPSVAGHPD